MGGLREEDPFIHQYTGADDLLYKVYGVTPYHNTGEHMPGGIDPVLDAFWRRQYKIVVLSKLKLVELPTGKTSEMIVNTLMAKFKGVREQKRNSERPLVFLVVILRQEPGVREYDVICQHLASRLRQWHEGKYATLVRNVAE